jgi:hypothetical protein
MLSAEIFFMIFEGFDFEQQVQCMLVCKNWARVLLSQYNSEQVKSPIFKHKEEGDKFYICRYNFDSKAWKRNCKK